MRQLDREHAPLMGQFFAFARERERIRLKKEAGDPRPWTGDMVLQEFAFCNVFRRDDHTSRWVQGTVTPAGYGSRTLGALLIARWFNRVETVARLLAPRSVPTVQDNHLYSWSLGNGYQWWERRVRERLEGIHPLTTGAFIVKTPNGMDKLTGLLWCLRQILPDAERLQEEFERPYTTIQRATERLQEYPYLGGFMSYEVTSDLVDLGILASAPDRLTWANPGPGARRGASWVLLGHENGMPSHQTCLEVISGLVAVANNPRESEWPVAWPRWTAREAEHTLCEFDKYKRASVNGQRLKRRYVPREELKTCPN